MTPMKRVSRLPTYVRRRSRNVEAGHSYAFAAVVAAGALAATALLNRHLAKKAEHDNPPAGQFLEVDGVRLHYVERGSGEALVLLHDRLGVSHAIVLGHSWGASIAVALALKFPAFVRGLVLASGYYLSHNASGRRCHVRLG